jgi:GntP family gluconate:H+ symporter
MAPPDPLLLLTALAVLVLIAAMTWWRLHPFIALVLVSLGLGLAAGVPAVQVVRAFQDGLGATLGSIGGILALGAMLGRLLAMSGGAEVLTSRMLALAGPSRAPWMLALTAFVVGLPVFFAVGFVLLMPVVFALVQATGLSLVLLGLPLAAGLSAAHGLTPPHPGPLAAIERLHADPGLVILYGSMAGIPAALVAGPVLARWLNRRVTLTPGPLALAGRASGHATRAPGAVATLATVLLPVWLMLGATASALWLPSGSTLSAGLAAAGQPLVALLAAVLTGLVVFGRCCGFTGRALVTACEECLGPIASALLVVGAGGGFGKVLDVAGVDEAIVAAARTWALSPLVLGWVTAVLLRVSVGSATVAITTAASLVAPIADAAPGTNRELLVVALGAGSLAASHVNDGGFWLVKEYFNASVAETLKTWTVLETVIAIVGLVVVLVLDRWM